MYTKNILSKYSTEINNINKRVEFIKNPIFVLSFISIEQIINTEQKVFNNYQISSKDDVFKNINNAFLEYDKIINEYKNYKICTKIEEGCIITKIETDNALILISLNVQRLKD